MELKHWDEVKFCIKYETLYRFQQYFKSITFFLNNLCGQIGLNAIKYLFDETTIWCKHLCSQKNVLTSTQRFHEYW